MQRNLKNAQMLRRIRGEESLKLKSQKLFCNLYSGSESYYLYIGRAFLLGCVKPAALPLVRCYSIRPPRKVASRVNCSSRRNESSSEHFVSDLSLLKADAVLGFEPMTYGSESACATHLYTTVPHKGEFNITKENKVN